MKRSAGKAGSTLVLLGLLGLATCAGPGEGGPGVVLVIVDTLRADHVSSYGYARATTPNLDRLASEGRRFSDAWAAAPWTLPSIATILTGLPPGVHGAGRSPDGRLHPLAPDVRTLAERLRESGFRTAAFVNVVFCAPGSGLARGFDTYDFHTTDATNRGHRDAATTTDAALAWLRKVGAAPFFLVVHYFDPHLTYAPPAPYAEMFEPDAGDRLPADFGSAEQVFALREGSLTLSPQERASLIARYDGEIRFVDAQLARLRAGLEQLERFERALVIVVSDHGEEFWDHGSFEHGHSHHRELLHVPLIVRAPGTQPGVETGRVRQLDIAPTVIDYAGLELPVELPGQVLGEGSAAYAIAAGSLWAGELLSIRSDEGTLIVNRTTTARSLFAPEDRAETRDVSSQEPALAARLEEVLALRATNQRLPAGVWELSEAERERLRSLGYLR